MKKLLLILLCLPMIGFGQGWIKNFYSPAYNFSDVKNVQQTSDLGYVIFNYNGLIKTNNIGDTLWSQQSYNGIEDGLQTLDDGYILLGYNELYKLDDSGVLQWTKTHNEGEGLSIEQTSDNGYVITGTGGADKADEHIGVVKTDSLGDTLWTCQVYPHNLNFDIEGAGRDIDETSDGNYIIAGIRYILNASVPSNMHALLAKVNNSGDTIWTKQYLFDESSRAKSVVENSFGNFVFAGSKRDSISPTNSNCSELLLVETDSQGNIIWVKTYQNGFCGAHAWSIEETNDGGYVICGDVELQNGEDKIWLLKTNNQGDTVWTRTFGDPYGWGIAAKQTADGGYIITGWGYQNSFSYSIMLIKIDGNGNVTSTFNIPMPSSNRKLEKTVDMLGRETKPKTNTPFIEIYNDGTVEKRIIIE